MPTSLRNALLASALLLATAPDARALIFDAASDSSVVVQFQFAPTAAVEPWTLVMSFPSSLVPPTVGYTGCILELHDAGGLISSGTITSIFGCNAAFWFSDGGTGNESTAGINVDLSGIAAGEVGTIFYRPTFLPGPAAIASLDPPNVQFSGVAPANIIAFEIPEPGLASLLLVGVGAVAVQARRGR